MNLFQTIKMYFRIENIQIFAIILQFRHLIILFRFDIKLFISFLLPLFKLWKFFKESFSKFCINLFFMKFWFLPLIDEFICYMFHLLIVVLGLFLWWGVGLLLGVVRLLDLAEALWGLHIDGDWLGGVFGCYIFILYGLILLWGISLELVNNNFLVRT